LNCGICRPLKTKLRERDQELSALRRVITLMKADREKGLPGQLLKKIERLQLRNNNLATQLSRYRRRAGETPSGRAGSLAWKHDSVIEQTKRALFGVKA
jgi:hypothetical protein